MRGASALGDLLKGSNDAALRVFVVWEPVVWSDLGPPLTYVLGRISDRRAAQFWDKERLVSDAIQPPAPPGEAADVVWDCIALFPPGAPWEERLPPPAFIDCPVIKAIPAVSRWLTTVRGAGRAPSRGRLRP